MDLCRFRKLHGCGNSFIVVRDDCLRAQIWQRLALKVSDYHFGIGSDGLMVVMPSTGADFDVHMFNPDGTPMGMCGNGIRCVCRYLYLEKLIAKNTKSVRLAVGQRILNCVLHDDARLVSVDMGEPNFDAKAVPVHAEGEVLCFPLSVTGVKLSVTALSMGNPHCVAFVDSFDGLDWQKMGALMEHHELFPQRTNVEFVTVLSARRLRVKVWERGAGATLACGTGACAALAAAVRNGFTEEKCVVELPGGNLDIEWQRNKKRMIMSGPASEICEGYLSHQLFDDLEKEMPCSALVN